MIKIIIFVILLITVIPVFEQLAEAHNPVCRMSSSTHVFPKILNGENRQNPDGSYWPGDGFFLIFKYWDNELCSGKSLKSLETSGNISAVSFNPNGNYRNDDRYNKYDLNAVKEWYKNTCNKSQDNEECKVYSVEISYGLAVNSNCFRNALYPNGTDFNMSKISECQVLEEMIRQNYTGQGKRKVPKPEGEGHSHVTQYSTTRPKFVPNILIPYNTIQFDWPIVNDVDQFPGKNLDATYYIDDPIGIHAKPNDPHRDDRGNTIMYVHRIVRNDVTYMDDDQCNKLNIDNKRNSVKRNNCELITSGLKQYSPFTIDAVNGDLLSTHYSANVTSQRLGLKDWVHYAEVYNLDVPSNIYRKIGEYRGTATALIVVYDPQIEYIDSWTRLDDGGFQSYDNNYTVGIKYLGSKGSNGFDDTSDIHPLRPMKITDIWFDVQMINIVNQTHNNSIDNPPRTTDVHGLEGLTVYDSVKQYIPNQENENDGWFDFSNWFDSNNKEQYYKELKEDWTDPANVIWNSEIDDSMIEKEGYMKVIRKNIFNKTLIEQGFHNITSFDTFISHNYAGKKLVEITDNFFQYPYGRFSYPVNISTYQITSNNIILDKQASIRDLEINEGYLDIYEFVSLPEYYMYNAYDEGFAFMQLSDMYEMNKHQTFNNNTIIFLLNKTGIMFDVSTWNNLTNNNITKKSINNANNEFTEIFNYLDRSRINDTRSFMGLINNTIKEVSNTNFEIKKFIRDDFIDFEHQTFMLHPTFYIINITVYKNNMYFNTIQYNTTDESVVKIQNITINISSNNHLEAYKDGAMTFVHTNDFFVDIVNFSVNGKNKSMNNCQILRCGITTPMNPSNSYIIYNSHGGSAISKKIIETMEFDDNSKNIIHMRLMGIVIFLFALYLTYRAFKWYYKAAGININFGK